MEISEKQVVLENEKIIVAIRTVFYLVAFLILLGMGIFYYLNADLWMVIMIVFFVAILFVVFDLNFCYVRLFVEKKQLMLQYYAAFSLKGREYRQIEIPIESLSGFKVEKHILGLKNRLVLEVRTKNGIAVYPPVILSAVGKSKQNVLKKQLQQILLMNNGGKF